MLKLNFCLKNAISKLPLTKLPLKQLFTTSKYTFARKKEVNTKMSDLFTEKGSIEQQDLSKERENQQLYGNKKNKEQASQTTDTKAKVELPEELRTQRSINAPQAQDAFKEQEEVQGSPERITTKILCDLIGTKHYPVNEEIQMDKSSLVSVYDEKDKLISTMQLNEAIEKAKSVGKEIILRNAKTKPPIVKMMKYRIELVKRLLKKLGKNMGIEFNKEEAEAKTKYMVFSQKMDKKDFNSKVDKLRQLLAENPYVRVAIPCKLDNLDQTAKTISILKSIADEIIELAKVRVGPVKQKRKSTKVETLDPSLGQDFAEIEKHDKIIKEAQEAASLMENNTGLSEKNLENLEYIYTEFESLIADTSGIDYEKLLENIKFEDIIKGITHTNALGEMASQSKEANRPITSDLIESKIVKSAESMHSINTNAPLRKQIELLEKEVVVQQDFGKRLIIQDKVEKMKMELELTRLKYTSKIIKAKMMAITKQSAEKAGMIGREIN